MLERLKAGGRRATEDQAVGWHHQLNGAVNLGKAPGVVTDREAWCAAIQLVAKVGHD